MMNEYESPSPQLDRKGPQGLVPLDFWEILTQRYFPVLSLTYAALVCGIAAKFGQGEHGTLHYIFESPAAYRTALMVTAWVSIPALLWILIRGAFHMARAADLWYKGAAFLMVVSLGISFFLFPDVDIGLGMRMFMVASIPVFIVQYLFFVRGGLPAVAAWPLTVGGITLLAYGFIL